VLHVLASASPSPSASQTKKRARRHCLIIDNFTTSHKPTIDSNAPFTIDTQASLSVDNRERAHGTGGANSKLSLLLFLLLVWLLFDTRECAGDAAAAMSKRRRFSFEVRALGGDATRTSWPCVAGWLARRHGD